LKCAALQTNERPRSWQLLCPKKAVWALKARIDDGDVRAVVYTHLSREIRKRCVKNPAIDVDDRWENGRRLQENPLRSLSLKIHRTQDDDLHIGIEIDLDSGLNDHC